VDWGQRGPNLIANPGFEDRSPGDLPASAAGLPVPWRWSLRPTEEARASVVDDQAHGGTRSLRVDPGPASNKAWWMNTARMQIPVACPPGAAYRFTAWIRAEREGAVAHLAAFSFQKDAHNWEASSIMHCGPEWRKAEFGITLPAPGNPEYKPTMKDFYFRINLAADSGAFWIDDVSLRAAEPLDSWQAWQATGQDRHSILADPLFVDPAHDDYRLRPDSPAFKLGFKPIAMEKIGPYADPLRATWPIVEAPGVRENPLPSETAARSAP